MAATAQGAERIIGANDAKAPCPFSPYRTMSRTQMWIAGSTLPCCTILNVEWYISGQEPIHIGNYSPFTIKCCSTTRTLGSDFEQNYGGNTPETVYFRTGQGFTPTANTWYGFKFDTPYEHLNNPVPLIIEVIWFSTGGVGCFTTWGRIINPVKGAAIYGWGSETYLYPENAHYLRITTGYVGIEPTSLGRIKTTYK